MSIPGDGGTDGRTIHAADSDPTGGDPGQEDGDPRYLSGSSGTRGRAGRAAGLGL